MAAIPSVDESLMTSPTSAGEKKGLPRNIHWVIIGFLIAALAVVILGAAIDQEKNSAKQREDQGDTERKAALGIDRPVDARGIDGIKAEQEATVPTIAKPTLDKLPPVPGVGGAPVDGAIAKVLSPEEKEKAAAAAERAARHEEAITTSNLLVIKGSRMKSSEAAEKAAAVVGTGSPEDILRLRNEALAAARNRMTGQQPGAGNPSNQPIDLAGILEGVGGRGGRGGELNALSSPAAANTRWLQEQAAQPGQGNDVIRVETPASATVLMQGAVIPAALITSLNSDMPGQIVGMITSDVYDSIRGGALIIPRGSKIYGQYNAEVKIGQERAMAAFSRLTRPDGSYINLLGMPAADSIGQSGLQGDVNNHFLKMFGASFMTAGLASLFDRNNTVIVSGTNTSGTNQAAGAAGEVLVDIAKRINQRNTNIPPTITVPAGERFVITVTRDIDIPPYRGKLPGQ